MCDKIFNDTARGKNLFNFKKNVKIKHMIWTTTSIYILERMGSAVQAFKEMLELTTSVFWQHAVTSYFCAKVNFLS
jgi:hypothetical protein